MSREGIIEEITGNNLDWINEDPIDLMREATRLTKQKVLDLIETYTIDDVLYRINRAISISIAKGEELTENELIAINDTIGNCIEQFREIKEKVSKI